MTPEEFKKHLAAMTERSQQFIDHEAPHIAANIAVSDFKQNFRRESFDGVKWQEVKRRDGKSAAYKYAARHHPARTSRKILTGDTGDLGRSIEIKSVEQGTMWLIVELLYRGTDNYTEINRADKHLVETFVINDKRRL